MSTCRLQREDECFLWSKLASPRRSLSFFPDLHSKISRSWVRPFSAHLFIPASDYYGNMAGLGEPGYKMMPWVEQTLASYLSPGMASSLKAPSLPSKPLRTTSVLVGKGYTAAGQAEACLHMMSVLQAYQADLLKELDDGEKVDVSELHRTADLALHATKETAHAIGWSMAAMWRRRDISGIRRCRNRRWRSSCTFLVDLWLWPCTSSLYREVQKLSIATRAPPSQDRDKQRSSHRSLRSSGPNAISGPLKAAPTGEEWVTPHYMLSVSPRCPQEASLLPLPVLQGAVVSSKHTSWACRSRDPSETLLKKEAIEVVPPHDRESGFYSRYFIVPRKDGGLRPILGLCQLNRSVMRLKFKMLTVKQVVSHIRFEDWFVTIDLKDAYYHVSILPQHRKFLWFAFGDKAYLYWVPSFGLALSPRMFTKCVDAALVPLNLQGIRILNYIDDWLILVQSESRSDGCIPYRLGDMRS
ncbi:Transposon Ty3-G Gag-Pol polyprotein [Labeo rohita]|uniref:ribonuclease H n=1 Tax=Labeo rohita TaxID=84645 RepID=A0ABQ8MHJ0_LABRO|nr:Transposon Ty3-G Gag-Pol polyprotein [Labeo rohita]